MVKIIQGIFFLLFLALNDIQADSRVNKASDPIIPVVNAGASQESISMNGLSAIFKMRLRTWQDGSPITVFVLDDDATLHKKFCKEILNVFPHQMRRAWNKLVFSGSGQAPLVLGSKEEMLNKIISTPGSIGYMLKSEITAEVKPLEIK